MSKKVATLAFIGTLFFSTHFHASERPKDINMVTCEKNYSRSDCVKRKLARDAEQYNWDKNNKK